MYNVRFDRTEQCLSRSREAVEKALEIHPEMPEALEALANYYCRGFLNYDRAYEILEFIRRKRPNYSQYLLATILSSQGKKDQALDAYEEAFKLNPRDSKLASIIGSINMIMRRYDEAEQWFNQALLIEPDMIYALANKGWIPCHWKGNIEESKALLEILPRHSFVNYLLFQAYLFERDYERAKELIASLSYDTFEYPWYYFQKDNAYATIYYLQNKTSLMCSHAETARMMLEKTIREQPNEPSRHSALGLAYAYLSQKDKAIREGKRALELHPISKDADAVDYIFSLAEIYSIIGERDKAIDQLEYLLSVPSYDVTVPILKLDPMWDPLRDHPRFQKLLSGED